MVRFFAVLLLAAFPLSAVEVVTVPAGADVSAVFSRLSGPHLVRLEAGAEYVVLSPITLASGQTLDGNGAVIRWSGGAHPVIVAEGSLGDVVGRLDANNGKPITIVAKSDGAVRLSAPMDGGATPSGGPMLQHEDNEVLATATGYKLLRRPMMRYPAGAEIRAIAPVSDVRIRNLCIIAGDASAGILLDTVADVTIDDVRVEGGRYGILARSAYRLTIRDVRVDRAVMSGIRVEQTTGGSISRSSIADSLMNAVFLGYGVWAFSLHDNEIYGTGITEEDGSISGGDGLTVMGAGNLLVTNNRILGTNCYGIWIVRASTSVVISSNVIIGSITAGILINGANSDTVRNVSLIGNVIDANDGGGIGLVPGVGVVALGNVLDGRRTQVNIGAGSRNVVSQFNVSRE